MTQLVTGEAVALDLRPAALPSRLVATVLDMLVQLALLIPLTLLLGAAVNAGVSEAAQAALTIVFVVLVLVGYPVAFETLWRGRTPGKAALGLRVVRDDGGPIAFRQAFVRGLAALFLERPGITFGAGAVITSLLNRDSKRLGDLLAGTIVLHERIPNADLPPVPMPPPLTAWAAELDLAALPDDLAQSVRSFLTRTELTPAARAQLGDRLVAAVAAVVTPPPPTGTPGWAYLAAVLAERRRRAHLQLGPPAYGGPPPPGYGGPPPPSTTPPPPLPPPPPPLPPAAGGFALPG